MGFPVLAKFFIFLYNNNILNDEDAVSITEFLPLAALRSSPDTRRYRLIS
jgi:hypothetical protein